MLQPKIVSKLPDIQTSIFAVMSGLANETGALNLSQGFPDFPISQELIELVYKYMKDGFNQYAPMPGILALRESISEKTFEKYGKYYHPADEITITAGATEALFDIISAVVQKGDEVIIVEPAYDSYAPAIELSGGIVKHTDLKMPDYHIDWNEVNALVSAKTKLIIINTPHNPTGSVLAATDLIKLQEITRETNILVLSDEVYEHLIFDGKRHESVCLYPELAEKSFVVGSFGKTFHATGWKTGFILAPKHLTSEVRKVHQFVTFASNTPVQMAMGDFIKNPNNYREVSTFYQNKRDFFVSAIENSRFKIIPCHGTYFQLLNYAAISDEPEMDFAIKLTKEHGIATVPVSPFYHDTKNNHSLRVCFAKKEETLIKAAEILNKI